MASFIAENGIFSSECGVVAVVLCVLLFLILPVPPHVQQSSNCPLALLSVCTTYQVESVEMRDERERERRERQRERERETAN